MLDGARENWQKWLSVTLSYSPLPRWAEPSYFEWLAYKVIVFAEDDECLQREMWAEVTRRLKYKAAYADYLGTDHWQTVRRQKIMAAGFQCERCGSSDALQVHHLTYENRGAERLEDLEVLCGQCHIVQHPEIS